MKKYLSIVLALLVFTLLTACTIGMPASSDVTSESASYPIVEYSASELSALLEETDMSGATVNIVGRVYEVRTNEIWIDRETKYGFFICETEDEITGIEKGNEVVVTGTIEKDFGNVTLVNCSVELSLMGENEELLEEYAPHMEDVEAIAFNAIPSDMRMDDTEAMADFSIVNDEPVFSINIMYVNYSTGDKSEVKSITESIVTSILKESPYKISHVSIDVWSDARTLEGMIIYGAEDGTYGWLEDGTVTDL